MNLKSCLLDSDVHSERTSADLNARQNSRGRYSPFQFVLRLSPEVHRQLDSLSNGVFRGNLVFDTLQACSTYLHETVHWWQHIGSTAGFVRSMSYPAQSHANFKHLKRLLEAIGPKKSVREAGEMLPDSGSPETPGGLANTIVNNHFDIEFYRLLPFQLEARLTRIACAMCAPRDQGASLWALLSLPQVLGDQGEFVQRSLQVLDDLGGDHVGGGQIGGVLQTIVLQPEDVQGGLVAFDQVVVAKGVEALCLLALVAIFGAVTGYEVVKVLAAQRVRLQRKVLVGAEIVDPQLLGPWLLAGHAAVKEQHIGLDSLRVKEARGQAQQRVHIAIVQQPTANGFASARILTPEARFLVHLPRSFPSLATFRHMALEPGASPG